MGLFSSKKKTYVSSTVYALGEEDGPRKQETLKQTVLNATMQQRPIGESLTDAYLRGQGMSLRNAFGYARDHFTYGVPESSARYLQAPDRETLTEILQATLPGYEIQYLALVTGTADHEWWAEQYLAKEFGYDRVSKTFDRPPPGVLPDAVAAYDLEPDGRIQILLMNPAGGSVKVVTFRPEGYVRMGTFVHAAYIGTQTFDSGRNTTTRAAEPGETDSVQVDVLEVVRSGETQVTTNRTSVTVSGSTATVVTQKMVMVTTRSHYYLYQLGSGKQPSLDQWLQSATLSSPYYPAVPLRVNNMDMCHENKKDTPLYKTSKKLMTRLGMDIDELAKSLNDNESIGEIDYAFVAFGVKLNAPSQESKRYLYNYFEYLRGISDSGINKSSYKTWVDENVEHRQTQRMAFSASMASMASSPEDGLGGGGSANTPPGINKVEIFSKKNRADNYDIKIQWNYIDTTIKEGVVFPGAGIGDVDISMSGVRTEISFLGKDMALDSSLLFARRQVGENSYEELEISGLYYENFIYQGKSISISAYDAFHDENQEGFIIPLNQQIVKSMSLVDLTDLSYHCSHMVINTYQVVKKKWYQTGWFKVLLFIVAVAVIVMTWGTATPVVISFLGVTLTVTGTLMIVLAATLYALSMMIVMNLLTKVAVQVFGEKWGPIIVMVGALFTMQYGQIATRAAAGAATTTVTAAQVMQVSTTLLNAYGHYQGVKAREELKGLQDVQKQWDKKFKELEEMSERMLGTSTNLLDIHGMIDATYEIYFEPMDQFLSRTLLVGGDIVEITNGQIENMTDIGLALPTIG